ncbi:MAG: hypothetical protein IPH07_17625 [Deltaproteobacteria bacterium]|nr:hypothetical protein [Deltaproteobacteria bacterium]MBK8719393.1 hypothetical protein [Deltaproteobacteria bacterium]MBP7291883.1 hypothetical protein [Nannocystaceae bacterium]
MNTTITTTLRTRGQALLALALMPALASSGCRDDDANAEASASGFTDSSVDDSGPGVWMTSADDGGGEPPGPDGDAELCDAGDEAWAKRVVPLIQGRRVEGIREARVIAQMVEQLDALGVDGRYTVALGLASGDHYLDRWKQWIYDQLRVNVNSDRRNEDCYDTFTNAAGGTDVAEHIRDNPASANFGQSFRLGDVVYSSLLLDDISPAYRADMYARQSAPVVAGNVTQAELEAINIANYGKIFESSYLGRFTECMDCHRTEMSVTDNADPAFDRHWPLPGNVELAVYGPDAALPNAPRAHAIFRRYGFSSTPWLAPEGAPPGSQTAWGMDASCGLFNFNADADYLLTPDEAYMVGEYELGSTITQLDDRMRMGFEALYDGGLQTEPDGTVTDVNVAFAWIFSANIANRVWKEAMGYPLTVANNFPRNEAQHDTMLALAQAFAENRYSLRHLLATLATNPYFNQNPPDACGASTAYHMPALFDPFTKSSSDPTARGNGVGDALHRYSAMVLLDSLSQAMWWDRAQRFGDYPGENQLPGNNCGTGEFPPCSEEPMQIDFLRDVGVFLNDSESGFNGVDFTGLLHWEQETGQGLRIEFGGDCTGPLGGACADVDWISQLLDVAYASPEATLLDVAEAVKDRIITESEISDSGEVAAIEAVMGAPLDSPLAPVAREVADAAVRRYAGVLFNTPQFLLAGVPSRDQSSTPTLVVPGTTMGELCNHLGALVLGNSYAWTCDGSGISISG